MRIYAPSAGDGHLLAVRWTLDGVYDQAHKPANKGVELPPGAEILDIILTGHDSQTIQLAFDPAHAEYFAEEEAA